MNGVMGQALDAFADAMTEAEKHRAILRKRFGLTDHQIGSMVFARRPRNTMSNYAAAVLAAKTKLKKRRAHKLGSTS
jgi:hypothetical protein